MTDLQIKCFLEVAKHLNFTKAAKEQYISQSHISRQIAALEEELSIALFDRNTKGVRLTAQGEMLAETLEEMQKQWKMVLIRAKNSLKKFSGSITIGCTGHAKSNSYLSQALSGFREMRPEVQIIKERNTQKKLIEGLKNDYYDAILIASHDVRWLQGVNTLTLFYSRVGIAIHKKHPLFHKKDVNLSDFKDSVFLRYSPTELELKDDFLYQLCKNFNFEPKIAAEFDDFEEFLFSIEMGEGVALLYEETEVISNMNLRFIPINKEYTPQYLPMQLTRKDKNSNPVLEDFYKYAQQYTNLNTKNKFLITKCS